jgi:hypothetical protein
MNNNLEKNMTSINNRISGYTQNINKNDSLFLNIIHENNSKNTDSKKSNFFKSSSSFSETDNLKQNNNQIKNQLHKNHSLEIQQQIKAITSQNKNQNKIGNLLNQRVMRTSTLNYKPIKRLLTKINIPKKKLSTGINTIPKRKSIIQRTDLRKIVFKFSKRSSKITDVNQNAEDSNSITKIKYKDNSPIKKENEFLKKIVKVQKVEIEDLKTANLELKKEHKMISERLNKLTKFLEDMFEKKNC